MILTDSTDKLIKEGSSVRWPPGVAFTPGVPGMIPVFEQVNAYIALVAVLLNLTLAAWVILRSNHHPIYITFMFVCFGIALWNFGEFMVYVSGGEVFPEAGTTHANPWKYWSSTGSAMAVAFLFHFMCALVRQGRKKMSWILLAYVTAGFFAVTSPMAFYYEPVRNFVDGTLWNILFGVTLVPFIVAGLVMLMLAMVRAEEKDEKSRWKYTIAAIVITFATGMTDLVQKLEFAVPPLGHMGAVIGPSILAFGIVKHRRVYDVLAKTRRRLDAMREMATGIAHEIRNPLTAIKGAVQLLAGELADRNWDEANRYQVIIDDEIGRLEGILASFRDFTRPIALNRELRSINEVVNRTVFMARMEELGIEIRTDLAARIPDLSADPALLRQVFINLVLNASEACKREGILVISTKWIPPWVVVDFRDNGPGIPGELRNRIFEPFYSTKSQGSGIGLAICSRIIDAHDGRIEAVREATDGGHIRIYLPVPSS